MAIRVSRIGHVAIRVRDLERAKRFYSEVLGFKVVEEDPEHGREVFMTLEYDKDGHTLDFALVDDPESAKPPPDSNAVGVAHIALKVDSHDDLRDAYEHLLAHGVAVNLMIEHANQRSIYFTDPEGNRIEIYYEFPTSQELFRRGRGDRDFLFTFEDPLPEWAIKVPDDWDPETTALRYHRGRARRLTM